MFNLKKFYHNHTSYQEYKLYLTTPKKQASNSNRSYATPTAAGTLNLILSEDDDSIFSWV